MLIFKRIYRKFVIRVYFSRAYLAASRENYRESMEYIEKYKILSPLPLQYKILEAVILYQLGQIDAAVSLFSWVFNHIKDTKDIGEDTQMYLASYIVYYLGYIDRKEGVEIKLFEQELPNYNYNLKKVNSRFQKMYPFPRSM